MLGTSSRIPLIRCRDVSKTYGEGEAAVHALRAVSLDIPAGQLVALVGASGSGKSTLLHVLGAMDAPDSGVVEVEGRDISRLSDAEAARFRRERVGFIFQFFNLVPTLSALDNVALPARLAGRSIGEARARAAELLARVGLAGRENARADQISGGQQQRVAIARALVNTPVLILADEPTGNLDRDTGEGVLALMQALVAESGVTLIMATHADEAVRRASRVLRVIDGRVEDAPLRGQSP